MQGVDSFLHTQITAFIADVVVVIVTASVDDYIVIAFTLQHSCAVINCFGEALSIPVKN